MKKLIVSIIVIAVIAVIACSLGGIINTQNIAYVGEAFIYFIAVVALVYNLKAQLKNL